MDYNCSEKFMLIWVNCRWCCLHPPKVKCKWYCLHPPKVNFKWYYLHCLKVNCKWYWLHPPKVYCKWCCLQKPLPPPPKKSDVCFFCWRQLNIKLQISCFGFSSEELVCTFIVNFIVSPKVVNVSIHLSPKYF